MEDVIIESMRASDLREAAVVVGRAFARLPTPQVTSERRQLEKERRVIAVFRVMFGRAPGLTLVARKDQRVVSAMRIVKRPQCQLSGLIMLPFMLAIERGGFLRWSVARYVWWRRDPHLPHWHIAPLSVGRDEVTACHDPTRGKTWHCGRTSYARSD